MALEAESRGRVRRFHQNVTLVGGVLLILGALAAGYLAFFRPSREFPAWLFRLRALFGP